MYCLIFHPKTVKSMNKLPLFMRQKVVEQINKLISNPFNKELNIKKLSNTDCGYRLRVGDIRVLYEVYQKTKKIYIHGIGFRGQIY